jgi:hypothetical protein
MLKEILDKMQVGDTIVIMVKKEKHRFIGVSGTYTNSIQSGLFEGASIEAVSKDLVIKTVESFTHQTFVENKKEPDTEPKKEPKKEKIKEPVKVIEKQPQTSLFSEEKANEKLKENMVISNPVYDENNTQFEKDGNIKLDPMDKTLDVPDNIDDDF